MGKDAVNMAKMNLNPILEGNSRKLIECAEEMGKHLGLEKRKGGEGMSTSQIRNIFDAVKRMDKYQPYNLDLMRAKIAYVAGRNREVLDLQEVLDEAIKKVDNQDKFKHFKDFFEAIVAYHRRYGKE